MGTQHANNSAYEVVLHSNKPGFLAVGLALREISLNAKMINVVRE
jgi:hypothetical protein